MRLMFLKLGLAAFLLAHGAIHAGFVSPRPPASASGPAWPFTLESSWLLGPLGWEASTMRLLGIALTAATVGGFALAALGALAVVPAPVWVAGASVGAVASIALLGLFFHPWPILGLAIDAGILWAALIARWEPAA
jgi:hypothetical protein